MSTRHCYDTVTNDTVAPDVCGGEVDQIEHECHLSICWDNVIQRRGQFGNPIDYFYRGLDEYVAGFGDPGELINRDIIFK